MMPALFIGHGSPMNAIEENEYTRNWSAIAKRMPKPKAVLAISAHWVTHGTKVTAMELPPTIHDFYGFPQRLNAMQYPAKGSPQLATLISDTIKSVPVRLTQEWGLDHGTWSVLVHMYPDADVPVLQLSIDAALSFEQMYALGKELKTLREQGILIIGLGNIVHNLGHTHRDAPWAKEFERYVIDRALARDDAALIRYHNHPAASLACPTPEHYVPLLYILGAAEGKPEISNEGIVLGAISMLCMVFG